MPIQIQQPSASSWGEAGYYKVWLNEQNSWMYPYQHDAERRMTELANRFGVQPSMPNVQSQDTSEEPWTLDLGLRTRLLSQAARELLLAQSSDWAFQIYQGTTVQYSTRRFQAHIHRFGLLAEMLDSGNVDTDLLEAIENRDNLFSEIDYTVFRTEQ